MDDPHAPVSLPINHALSHGRREGVVRPVFDGDQPGLTRRSDMRKPPVTWVVPGRKTWWRQALRQQAVRCRPIAVSTTLRAAWCPTS